MAVNFLEPLRPGCTWLIEHQLIVIPTPSGWERRYTRWQILKILDAHVDIVSVSEVEHNQAAVAIFDQGFQLFPISINIWMEKHKSLQATNQIRLYATARY